MKNTRRLVARALACGLGMAMWGCSTETLPDQPFPNGALIPNPGFPAGNTAPRFDPITPGLGLAAIPFPNDILRDPATGLNTRVPAGTDPADSLRTLRGFSTTGNIIIPFDGQIEASSVNNSTVLFIEGSASQDAAEANFANTTVPANITVQNPSGSAAGTTSSIIIQPVLPLKPTTNYYVVLTAGVRANGQSIGTPRTGGNPSINTGALTRSTTPLVDNAGNSLVFPVSNEQAQQLEPLRAAYQTFWSRAERITGLNRNSIPFVFRFGTQPLFASLASPRDPNATNPAGGNPGLRTLANEDVSQNPATGTSPGRFGLGVTGVPTGQVVAGPGSAITVQQFYADLPNQNANPQDAARDANRWAAIQNLPATNVNRVIRGTFTVANYINPATGFFQGENLPIAGSAPFTRFGDLTVEYFVLLPNPATFPGPRPSVIYQHGLNHDKRDVFLVGEQLTGRGFGVIAIDLYRHGALRQPNTAVPNGTGFINPQNMRGSRDNARQSISNLFYVSEAIVAGKSNFLGLGPAPNFRTPGSATPGVQGPPPAYIGHSLGGIVGVPFTAVTPFSSLAAYSAAGGRLTESILNSATIGPVFRAALAPAGLVPGTDAWQQFWAIFQTVADDIDPINYAAPTLAGGTADPTAGRFKGSAAAIPFPAPFGGQQRSVVLLQEIVGDQTVPNSATRDLGRAFGQVPFFRHVADIVEAVTGIQPAGTNDYQGPGYYQFPPGLGHEAILGLDGDAQRNVIRQIVEFLVTGQNPHPTGARIRDVKLPPLP